jgi:hypothetical protein
MAWVVSGRSPKRANRVRHAVLSLAAPAALLDVPRSPKRRPSRALGTKRGGGASPRGSGKGRARKAGADACPRKKPTSRRVPLSAPASGRGRKPKTGRARRLTFLERNLRDVDRAVGKLGRERVKPGPIRLGGTRSRVAGRRGVKSVSALFEQTSRATALKTFTYTVSVRRPDGTVITRTERQTLPRLQGVRDTRKIKARIERELWDRIHDALIEERVETDPVSGKRVKLTRSGALRKLSGNVTFKVEVFAEV